MNKIQIILISVFLMFSISHGQILNKIKSKAKNAISSETEILLSDLKSASTEKAIGMLCKKSGATSISESSAAYTSYKNLLKQVDLAEKNFKIGGIETAENNLKNVVKYAGFVIKKEPNADFSAICGRLSNITSNVNTVSSAKADFAQLYYKLNFFVQSFDAYVVGMFEASNAKTQKANIEAIKEIDREHLIAQLRDAEVNNALDFNGKELKRAMTNVDQLLKDHNIINRLYGMLDELDKASPIDLKERSERALVVLEGFKAIGGDNEDINAVLDYANKQVKKADNDLASIYTGDFHKDNINKIIFTKQPFKVGQESSVEINPVFEVGDAVYATLYLKGKISDIIDANLISSLSIEDESGNDLDRWFEAWEVENYTDKSLKILPSTNLENTTYQFVLIPNQTSSIRDELSNKNITPIHLARGAAKQPARKKTFSILISSYNSNSGSTDMNGSFQFDFSSGNGEEYYNALDNQLIEELISEVELPSAAMRNTNLEQQLLSNMKSQGWKEQYTKAIIVSSDWSYYKPIGEKEYKEIEAAFPYKLPDGKCGYQIFSFKSFKNGSGGWTAPQKFGGTDGKSRIKCSKI